MDDAGCFIVGGAECGESIISDRGGGAMPGADNQVTRRARRIGFRPHTWILLTSVSIFFLPTSAVGTEPMIRNR